MSAECIDNAHYPVWERGVLNGGGGWGWERGFHRVMQEKARACEHHGKGSSGKSVSDLHNNEEAEQFRPASGFAVKCLG